MDKNIDPRTAPLLAFDAQEIARQMTISTWKNWSAIKPWEFLELAWTKKAGKAKHGMYPSLNKVFGTDGFAFS
jgi:hypothetical protein